MLDSVMSISDLTHFRQQRPGPEAILQNHIAAHIPQLFFASAHDSWIGASVPLGAGIPDLVVASYQPQVFALADLDLYHSEILAYLRVVRRASLEEIAHAMRTSSKAMSRVLKVLLQAEAVSVSSKFFSLSPPWRNILPEIITVEVKVSNWQRAIEQAGRNRIFAHRSFIALPAPVAKRVCSEGILNHLGIGLLAIYDDKKVITLRKARRRKPSVWAYYYRLASMLARSGSANAYFPAST